MANTLSVMTNVLRNAVSKQRIRYKEKGFNLDLAYICDNIIAMGYPADNIESIYRNRIEDVYKFFEENYHDHYKIYNLCLERSYDVNKFHGRVAVYPFEDHNPPTIELIQKFCHDVDCWLKADPSNVAAIHCKAGKGRTGTMICCYLLYSGIQRTAEDALACYDEKRTKDRKGVTIPSQRRYVQYFAKLTQSGLPYERRTLQFCEIRFTDANLLHNQGVVNCSISLLHDISTLKVQTLQTHTIDFRKSMIIEINNPPLSVTGDIKVELTHKSSRKKIFHFWFNTYFACDNADIEDNGEFRKFVYTLYKNEIDDAHKDKEHKCFSEDFKVQVVFLPVNSEGKNSTNINIIQQSGSTIHSEVSQDSNCTQHNSTLPQNSSSSSNLNYICDQKTSSSASACSLSVNRTSRYKGEDSDCAQESGSGGLQASLAIVENAQCNKTTTASSEGFINEKMTNERIKKSTASIPTYSYPMQPLKSPLATLTPTFYQNQNYPILQNQFHLETDKICFKKQQQLYKQQPKEEQHNPSVNASKSSRSSNKQCAVSVNSNCINRHVDDTSGHSNSNECSSSSISSHSSSSAAGDNEEDWESGESSPKPLAHNKELFSSPTSNTNTHYSLNLYNSSSCIENKIGSDDDDNNDKYQYFNGNDNEAMTIFNDSNLGKTCGCCKGSIVKPCKSDTKSNVGETGILDNLVSITSGQSQELIKLQASTAAASANVKKPISGTKSLKSANLSTSKSALEQEATCSSLTLHCDSSTGLASTSKQKLKNKLKKNKLKHSKKFQWFQNYFRNDPIDFCENVVQRTTAMRRNSNCSVASRSHKLSTTTPPPPHLGCFPRLSSTLPMYAAKPTNLDLPTEQVKSITISDLESSESKKASAIPSSKAKSAATSVSDANLSTVDNFDFYSSICDKQLSFSNSPCKSPRSLVDIISTDSKHSVNYAFGAQGSTIKRTEPNDINEKSNSKGFVVVAAKPAKTNAIGFNVANLVNTADSHKVNCNLSSQVAIHVDQNINNPNSKDLVSYSTPPSENTDDLNSISFPFEFPNMKHELDKLEKVNNCPSNAFTVHRSKDEKNKMESSMTGRDTILNLVIIKEISNSADQTHKSQHVSPEKTKSHSKYTNVCIQSGGGNIVSDSSNSSSSGFCTSECCTNSSSSSVCSCNPFALDLERHTATKRSAAEESNENHLHESSKTALTKSNVNSITRDVDVIGVLERTIKQFVDY